MAGIRLAAVSRSYGTVAAVRDLSLTVADGELLVLLGPSGCGKTTTLRAIAGLERIDGGTIEIGDRDVTAVPAGDRDVAMVFQSYALFPHLTVERNVAFGLQVRGTAKGTVAERVRAAAEALGLEGLLRRRPAQLSGGERQRVALARAMVREPAAFLMDEPLSNLDAPLRLQTRTEIVALQRRLGTTTVYVTHDQAEALAMGHRVGVMRTGTLEQIGSPEDVYERPRNIFVARFVGNGPLNLFEVHREGRLLMWGGRAVTAPESLEAGGSMLLGVRPEHVQVRGSLWSEHADPGEWFGARVISSSRAGDQSFLTVESEGATIVARVEGSYRAEPGARVEIWFDPARILLFDPETEVAL